MIIFLFVSRPIHKHGEGQEKLYFSHHPTRTIFVLGAQSLYFPLILVFGTVKPHHSAFREISQNYIVYFSFSFCENENNYKTISLDQNWYLSFARFHNKRVRYSGVSLNFLSSLSSFSQFSRRVFSLSTETSETPTK